MTAQPFFITTPIFYPNGVPHIGHAYTAIATDVIARYQRLDGRDVLFLTGTDEHGQKMQQTAAKEGLTPLELATRNSNVFRELWAKLNISYDDYIRTTEDRHHRASEAIWQRMTDAGDIYLDKYAGWYSVRQEAFFDEKETTLGDDGVRREPLGSPVEWVEEESYFFRLSAFGDRLMAHYEANPDFIAPSERRNEVMSFVKSGLRDLSVSRATFDWGISVPGNDKHVMYVWVDALTNYITATGFPDENNPRRRFWPADVHMIGKDIIRFHAVYWPAFLMSAGLELPKRVFAHGFLFNRGEKMSKSVGNVVDPFELTEKYGRDALRYYLLREVPFGQDGSYSHEAIVNRINADLANDLGNLAQRSLSMVNKHCGAAVPTPGAFTADDQAVLDAVDGLLSTTRQAMSVQALHNVLSSIWQVVSDTNRYFAAQAPWALRKTDPARMATVLYVTVEALRQVAILCQPVMPESAARLLDLLGVAESDRSFDRLGNAARAVAGRPLPAPEGVFPRYVEPDQSN
ncbi:methionine--tRNA ligase [Devosia sp. PTR5]|uniref:Methionine--tRNA ligase n=1 Tax=Devosia oryzisoli TaxID=2774138 RepID=A0A927ISA5_9HYPH|nr:methionine--tRNA ligase [Devosia oryzisoli]MBD8064637.1 methionine--tRNA ligase [Devosia oryzisoli]